MAHRKENKRKREEGAQTTRKRRQLVLGPKDGQPLLYSEEDATLPLELSGISSGNETVGEVTMQEIEDPGDIISDDNSLSDLSEEEEHVKETDPTRHDRPIVYDRWDDEEVDALMTALNVNRDAIKFHFSGPGGGKDVKRQAWRDVAGYVNDVANTHRTVKQCRDKAADYTQRCKAKFNKLRFAISTTGKGKIRKGLQLKPIESKALDYLREEAVKGIPGIEPMDLGEGKKTKASRKNNKLLWVAEREGKPKYDEVEMKKEGVPYNYRDKNSRRLCRLDKLNRQKEHAKEMKKERKKEQKEVMKKKHQRVREKAEEKELRSAFKIKRKEHKEERKRSKEEKRLKKEKKKLKKEKKELKKKEKELRKQDKKLRKKQKNDG